MAWVGMLACGSSRLELQVCYSNPSFDMIFFKLCDRRNSTYNFLKCLCGHSVIPMLHIWLNISLLKACGHRELLNCFPRHLFSFFTTWSGWVPSKCNISSLLIMNLISKAFLSLDLLYVVKRNHMVLSAFV